jgi:hypothetical protein
MNDDDDTQGYLTERETNNIRNLALEEVAQEIEKMTAFGQDTVSSFAVFVREMKRERFC